MQNLAFLVLCFVRCCHKSRSMLYLCFPGLVGQSCTYFSPLNGALYTFKPFSVKMGKILRKNTFSNYVPSEDMSDKI